MKTGSIAQARGVDGDRERVTGVPSVVAAACVLIAGTVAVYGRTFSVPLLLDDSLAITGNPSIVHLWPLGPVLSPPDAAGVGGRPLLNLSYALNYALGGASVAGYHAVNLGLHVLAALVLFGIVRRTLRAPRLRARLGAPATGLALVVSALWAWHPLQTEAVTYLSQRAEVLMGLCYLTTLYAFVRATVGIQGRGSAGWLACSVAACLLGVGSKEVIVTAPAVVWLYDRTFAAGSFREAWRLRRGYYVALVAALLPLAVLMSGIGRRGVSFGGGVPWWAYGLTECRVVVRYALLSIWPSPLVFDYGTPITTHLIDVWPYACVLAGALALALLALVRAPAAGFAVCGSLFILAPTSSIIPLVGQPMAESRMYLPLAGLVALLVTATYLKAGRGAVALLVACALALAGAAFRRNEDYASALSIWKDTVAKNPLNARALTNLGNEYLDTAGDLDQAVDCYRKALDNNPAYAEAHLNLGRALDRAGRRREALAEFDRAVFYRPESPEAHTQLGMALLGFQGQVGPAISHFEQVARMRPGSADAHYNLGCALAMEPRRRAEAVSEFQAAVRLNPDFIAAHGNLGNAFAAIPGRLDDAVSEYEQVIRLAPDSAQAHLNLAMALLRLPGRQADAVAHLQAVLGLQPDNAQARSMLERLRPGGN